MIENLSPKDLAFIIGVSESSLKRWVDEGRLSAHRTAGGHRRIPIQEAVRFIRATSQTVVHPELLGLQSDTAKPLATVAHDGSDAALLHALEHGQIDQAKSLIIAQFLTERSVACLFDGPISHAMHRVGEYWIHSREGILVEHRATEICLESIHAIRALLPVIPPNPRVAVGGGAPNCPYQMPSLMAATVLMEVGYRDINLGPNLPTAALLQAAVQHGASLVWLSASSVADRDEFVQSVSSLARQLHDIGATLVLGGRAMFSVALPPLPSTHVVASMSELAALARALRSGQPPRSPAAPVVHAAAHSSEPRQLPPLTQRATDRATPINTAVRAMRK